MSVFSGQIDVLVRAARRVPPPLSASIDAAVLRHSWAVLDGTSPRGARRMVCGRSVVAMLSGNESLLTGAVDGLGDTFNFQSLRALIVHNRSAAYTMRVYGSMMLVVQGDFSHSIIVRPGGTLVLLAPEDGYSVVPSVTDMIGFEAVDGDVEYEYVIIGT